MKIPIISSFWIESHNFPFFLDSERKSRLFRSNKVSRVGENNLINNSNAPFFKFFLFSSSRIVEKDLKIGNCLILKLN